MATMITGISTAVVEANYDLAFVRVHTSEGIHGTGECFPTPAAVPLAAELGELLIGKDPRQVVPLTYWLRGLLSGTGSSSGAGIAYNVLSGLETALWDVAGKLDGRPVAELLGGRFLDEVPLYMDCHAGRQLESMTPLMQYRVPWWASTSGETQYGDFVFEAAEPAVFERADWASRARAAIDRGFRKLKFDLDSFAVRRRSEDRTATRRDIDRMIERATWLREDVGDDVEIAFDCHWRFDVPSAIRIAEGLADVGPMWLEDPVPPDPAALAMVNARSPVPIATGENTYLVEGFRALFDAKAISVATPDAQKAGGLAETRRIFEDARVACLQSAPHCIASPLGLVATAHASAAATGVICIEFHGVDVPFWHELVDSAVIHEGHVIVPQRPGLGVELDEDVIRRYSRRGEPVFEPVPTHNVSRRPPRQVPREEAR